MWALTKCRDIKALLNTPYIRKLLNTDDKPEEFLSVSFDLFGRFTRSGDTIASSDIHIAGLLERGVRVLLYAGTTDLLCSWIGVEATSRAIPWSGQQAFGEQEMKEWEVDGRKAGKTRKWANLTFASVYDAGHQVSKLCEGIALMSDKYRRRRMISPQRLWHYSSDGLRTLIYNSITILD